MPGSVAGAPGTVLSFDQRISGIQGGLERLGAVSQADVLRSRAEDGRGAAARSARLDVAAEPP